MTKAEEFRAKRLPDYKDTGEFFKVMLSVDPEAILAVAGGGGVQVLFSDGSSYRIGLHA